MTIIEFSILYQAETFKSFINEVCGVVPPYSVIDVYPKYINPNIYWINLSSVQSTISAFNFSLIAAYDHQGDLVEVDTLFEQGHRIVPEE